jgi:class 3 adenylate cyclase
MADTLQDLLKKYYQEAVGGMVQKAPSELNRGEATEIDYFIFKIDLVDSTKFAQTIPHRTYLKLAHTFLSSIDEITRKFGADVNQAEYVGDGIIAYFPASKVNPIIVLKAAFFCRLSALEMKKLDVAFARFPFWTKSVIHYGKLIMAKIGPWGDSFSSAIGPELHKACKMEDKVSPGQGLVSKEFAAQLPSRERSILLKANYKETQIPKPPKRTLSTLDNLFNPGGEQSPLEKMFGIRPAISPAILGLHPFKEGLTLGSKPLESTYETRKEVIDYSIHWDKILSF